MKAIAQLIVEIISTDRYVFCVFTGSTGEGKSCLSTQLCHLVAKIKGVQFSYENNLTYKRSELKKWIDGEGEDQKGRKPEGSIILADELIDMFFKRNWQDDQQIEGVQLLNKCRDRHHFILGCVPHFWDLDSGVFSNVTLWIHIPKRGVAHVFVKDKNPFTKDVWHQKENQKMFTKYGHPYNCKGYRCTITFNDWEAKDKSKYYEVRNKKRVNTFESAKRERYKKLKEQRDALIRKCFDDRFYTQAQIAEITMLDATGISKICTST